MANLRTKDGANQDRYILSDGSGTDADPTILKHSAMLYNATGSALGASSGSPLGTELALIVRNIPSGTQTVSISGAQDVRQATASALNATVVGAVEVRQSLASALRATAEIYQAAASALQVTAQVSQATASALNATVTQVSSPSGWTTRLVTPSGDTAMDTGLSAARVYVVGGSTAGFEVRQANASALQATAEVRQATASALNATVTQVSSPSGWTTRLVTPSGDTAMDTGLSAARVYVVGGSTAGFEARQGNASALKATAEIYQATASALQVTATQGTNASGWTVRVVTPSGDTAMDTSNSAVRVNLVAGGAGNGNIQDGVQSNLAATVKGYASGSPLMVALTDSAGAHIPSLDVKQTTASALQATVTQVSSPSGWTVRVVTPSGDTAMDTSNSAVRVNLVAGGAGNGNIQDGAASQIAATVRGYANASPLAINLTDASGINIPTLPVSIAGVVDVKQTTASALNATVVGAVEVRQSLASALQATAEVRQATASALRGTMEVYQSLASAFQTTAEVRQATASALNAFVQGEVAHDGVDSGNPQKIGGKATEASPTNVATLDRVDAYFDKAGRLMVRTGNQGQDQWTATCAPGIVAIRATAVKAAGASGVRNVCTGLTVTMGGGSAAPAASFVNVNLLDGPSGTNILWTATLAVPATAGAMTGIALNNLWIKSSQASALALEFNSGGGVNVFQSVAMFGTTIVE